MVTSRSFDSGEVDAAAPLCARGLEVLRSDPSHEPSQLRPALKRAVAWIAGTGSIRGEHLDLAPSLRVIARYGVGVDTVDLEEAARRGIVVTNTPGANSDSVADYALALLIAAIRHVVDGDRAARSGDRSGRPGREISALTIGIIGFGRVGRGLARRLVGGFGARVLVHDPYVEDDAIRAAGCQPGSLLNVVSQVDALSLHLPGGGLPLVGPELLTRVRRGMVLVNTARGDLLDEDAVAAALDDGTLSAVAVDVLNAEHGAGSVLLKAQNVVVTPHLAAQTVEAVDRMGTMAVAEILRVLDGEAPLYPATRLREEVSKVRAE